MSNLIRYIRFQLSSRYKVETFFICHIWGSLSATLVYFSLPHLGQFVCNPRILFIATFGAVCLPPSYLSFATFGAVCLPPSYTFHLPHLGQLRILFNHMPHLGQFVGHPRILSLATFGWKECCRFHSIQYM